MSEQLNLPFPEPDEVLIDENDNDFEDWEKQWDAHQDGTTCTTLPQTESTA